MAANPKHREMAQRLPHATEHEGVLRLGGLCGMAFGVVVGIFFALLPTVIPIVQSPTAGGSLLALSSRTFSWEMVWVSDGLSDLLILVAFLGFYYALRPASLAGTLVALISAVLAVGIDLAADLPLRFAMVQLSGAYLSATQSGQVAYTVATELALSASNWSGSLSATLLSFATILVCVAMLRSELFGRLIAYIGIAASICVLPVFLFAPPLGWFVYAVGATLLIIWSFLSGFRLLALGRSARSQH